MPRWICLRMRRRLSTASAMPALPPSCVSSARCRRRATLMDPAVAQRDINSPWESVIAYAASTYNIPVALIKAVISQESAWDQNAVNAADPSYGLMQINTLAHPDVSPQNALDPYFNITY